MKGPKQLIWTKQNNKMQGPQNSSSEPLDVSCWDSPDDWPPKGLVLAGIQHCHYSDPTNGEPIISTAYDYCRDIRKFADEYFRELTSLVGRPDLYKDPTDEYPKFFGRWAVWFGHSAALVYDLRAAISGSGTTEEVDIYLFFKRKPSEGEDAWKRKILSSNESLPDAEYLHAEDDGR